MNVRHRSVVLASVAADALALGAHWIYDTRQIDQQIGRVDTLRAPLPTSFHSTKSQGDLTHYGDQTVLLLKSLVAFGGFDPLSFSKMWRAFFTAYTGYRDHATKETLQHLEDGMAPEEAGSASSDLGGAARIAPLVYFYHHDANALVAASRQQTAMTHRAPDVVDSAAFFARVAASVLAGGNPLDALRAVVQNHFDRPPFAQWVAQGIDSRSLNTREAIRQFGQACDVGAAFPGVIHLIARYQDRPREGLIENVMAGGDSAARGLIAGMIFGAASGREAVAEDWLTNLNGRRAIEGDLDALAKLRADR